MFNNIKTVIMIFVATLGLWLGVAMMHIIANDSGLTNFAGVMAVLASVTLWLVWGLASIANKPQETQEKAKRKPAEDARLALLLELMDEDDRQQLRQRLVDELSGDGEAISLADLLAAQNSRSEQR